MVTICGDVYESTEKFRIEVPLRVTKLEEIGASIGYRCIDVDYVVWIHPMPNIARITRHLELRDFISHLVLYGISDKGNWKMPARGAYETTDFATAIVLLDALVYICGGAWLLIGSGHYNRGTSVFVWTKGYYHYIGA
jgi:hypothetical protein